MMMMMQRLYIPLILNTVIFVLILLLSSLSPSLSSIMDGTGIYTFNISHTTTQAKHMLTLKKHNYNNNPNVLAIMILFTYGLTDKTNLKQLHCNIHLLQLHMSPYTPIHIYIWLGKYNIGDNLPYWMINKYDNLFIMPIDKEIWKICNHQLLRPSWMDYYIMGRWRLLFQPYFIYHMNYNYFLQLDMDTFLTNKIEFNILDIMISKSIYFSTTNKIYKMDPLEVLNGLAEFTRFWIVTKQYNVKGGLYETTNPSSIQGLYTNIDNNYGWNRYIYGAYFMLFDINQFWFDSDAQDYLFSILRAGYDVEQRWLEQGVENMMMLLFIKSENKRVFTTKEIQLSQGILEMVANCTSMKV
jgi:hypothetical protein